MAISVIGGSGSTGTTGLQQYEEIITSSKTWTKPTGVKTVEVTCIGASSGSTTSVTTGAGGGWKGIIDVSSVSTVPVIIGAPNFTTGTGAAPVAAGTTSFGTFVAATGSLHSTNADSGKVYFPNFLGNFGPGATGSVRNTTTAFATGTAGPTLNGRSFIIAGSTESYTDDGITYTTYTPNGTVGAEKRGVYVSGVYMLYSTANNTSTISRSTDGINFTSITPGFTGFIRSITNGPNGLLASSTTGELRKSTDLGATWTAVTPTGYTAVDRIVLSDTTYYYSFILQTASQTAYLKSTDGVTWTAGTSATAFTLNSTNGIKHACEDADSIYVWSSTLATLRFQNGVLLSAITGSTGTATGQYFNGGVSTDGNGAHIDLKTRASVFLAETGIASPTGVLAVSPSRLITVGNSVANSFTLYKGSMPNAGTGISSTDAGGGAAGPAYRASTNTPNGNVGGAGIDGWGNGGSGIYPSRTFGSGSYGAQGVVRVRWMA